MEDRWRMDGWMMNGGWMEDGCVHGRIVELIGGQVDDEWLN